VPLCTSKARCSAVCCVYVRKYCGVHQARTFASLFFLSLLFPPSSSFSPSLSLKKNNPPSSSLALTIVLTTLYRTCSGSTYRSQRTPQRLQRRPRCAMLLSILPSLCSLYSLPSAVLCCAVLYCTMLYCTVLCCTVLCCAVLYCAVLHCTVLSTLLSQPHLHPSPYSPFRPFRLFQPLDSHPNLSLPTIDPLTPFQPKLPHFDPFDPYLDCVAWVLSKCSGGELLQQS
jgi:hypothetical protein